MALELYHDPAVFRAACESVRAQGGSLGLVPTMGALHSGHMALVQEAKRLTTKVAVTLFVNPTQFSAGEDFGRYPRTLDHDRTLCESNGVELLFVPSAEAMYPPGDSTRVRVTGIADGLCGAFRAGHFEGVATVVSKFFGLAGTCTAVFGKKDYQQLKVIERLAKDLMLPVTIVGHPIVREPDGVAMSSRNAYLTADERRRASAIVVGLSSAWRSFEAGERSAPRLIERLKSQLVSAQLDIQYAELTHPESLETWSTRTDLPERVLLAAAAYCGKTRLIDNVVLGEDPDPLDDAGAGNFPHAE